MIPDNLHIGPIHLHIFGLMVALGFLGAAWAIGRELGRKGYDPGLAWNLVTWAALGGLAGARLWALIAAWPEFVEAPLQTLINSGGLVWYGGLIVGTIAVSIFFRKAGIPWLRGADAAAPGLVLGHAIGRIGCQLAGDGDWGKETTLPIGMAYPHAVVGWNYPPGVRVHPTPLYEFAAYLAIFFFLWHRRNRPAPDGTAFATYLVLAGLARFAIEFVRINPPVLAGLSMAQLFSLVMVVVGSLWLVTAGRRREVEAQPSPRATSTDDAGSTAS